MSNIHPACKPVSGEFHLLNVQVKEHVAKSFTAFLTCNIKVPYMKAVQLEGPSRSGKKEAIKDGMELGRKFLAEGEAGARSVALKLKKTKWSPQQLANVDEKDLYTNHPLPGFRDNQELFAKEEELLPPGEGWTRHSPTMLVQPHSQVYFVQSGDKAQWAKRPQVAHKGEDLASFRARLAKRKVGLMLDFVPLGVRVEEKWKALTQVIAKSAREKVKKTTAVRKPASRLQRRRFDVLLTREDELDVKQANQSAERDVRTAYKKLALRVHPDKKNDTVDKKAYQYAFARLEESKEKLEEMIAEDLESCREIRRVLHAEVHTRSGAAALLNVDWTPASDSILEEIEKEAAKAAKELKKKFAKLQAFSKDFSQAEAICDEAVRTMARPCTVESLPRVEALLKEGVQMSRALGLRDLRSPRPVVKMEPQVASCVISTGAAIRVALLCGATSAVEDAKLVQRGAAHTRRPKASALGWVGLPEASSAAARGSVKTSGAET
ncbi:unnamed protein product [Effrenium voratum]|nr:unnamed protein product [Effrenium voratum]